MSNEIESRTSAGTIMFSFLLGGIVGAGLALLLAPQSGAETRRKLREISDDVRDKAADLAGRARGSVEEALEKGKDTFTEKRSAIASAIEAGKEAYHREKEKGA